jgi:GGDEF domain-containing protein
MKTLQYILDPVNSSPAGKLRFYLLFIDFDDFKQVNDTFGHDVGDLLIIEISKRFKALIRPYSYLIPEDIYIEDKKGISEALFRIGGDEFTAIISDISMEEMEELVTELVNTVKTPYLIDGNEVHISCSVGICIYPDQADTAESLIKHADQAMYHAKKGKNQFYFYREE